MTDFVVASEDDRKNAERLQSLLGGASVTRAFGNGHPLRPGFAALDRHVGGYQLTDEEREHLNVLGLHATLVFERERDWTPFRTALIRRLKSAKDALSLFFELRVGLYALRPNVDDIVWRTYTEGAPDWRAVTPDFDVECKLARSGAKAENYQSYLKSIDEQHPDQERPLMAAIGFDTVLEPAVISDMPRQAQRHLPWMTRHRNVTAVLVFGRTGGTGRGAGPGGTGFRFDSQTVIEIRNRNARHPLADDVRFGSGPEVHRQTFPGAMKSLREPVSGTIRSQ